MKKADLIEGWIFLLIVLVLFGVFVSNSEFFAIYAVSAIIIMIFFTIIVRQNIRMYAVAEAFKKDEFVDDGNAKRKVYLIEGASGRKKEIKTGKLVEELKSMGLEVVLIDHMKQGILHRILNATSIEEFAFAAYPQFAKLRNQDIVIGYSMGCLVVRYILEIIGIKNKPTVILVGGPHLGSRLKYAVLFLVPCIREMLPGSSFLSNLGLPKNKSYWYFVARDDEKLPNESACPVESDQVCNLNCGHRMLDHPECIRTIKEIISDSNPS